MCKLSKPHHHPVCVRHTTDSAISPSCLCTSDDRQRHITILSVYVSCQRHITILSVYVRRQTAPHHHPVCVRQLSAPHHHPVCVRQTTDSATSPSCLCTSAVSATSPSCLCTSAVSATSPSCLCTSAEQSTSAGLQSSVSFSLGNLAGGPTPTPSRHSVVDDDVGLNVLGCPVDIFGTNNTVSLFQGRA